MKKRNGFVIASAVHLALWGILLVNSVIDLLAVVCFPPMDTDMPLGYLPNRIVVRKPEIF